MTITVQYATRAQIAIKKLKIMQVNPKQVELLEKKTMHIFIFHNPIFQFHI